MTELHSMNFNLGYEYEGRVNYFSSLAHNRSREFFFHMLWKNNVRPTIDFDGQTPIGLDHISFHRDGAVLFTGFDQDSRRQHGSRVKLPKAPSDIERTYFAPLVIFSIYQKSILGDLIGQSRPPLMKMSNINFKFELVNANGFSIVPILVGAEVDYKKTLEEKFPGVFITSASPMIYNIFGDPGKVKFDDRGRLIETNEIGLMIAYSQKKLSVNGYPAIGFHRLPDDEKILSLA